MIYQRGFLARPLDAVLGHASRLAALRVLVAHPEGFSGRRIAEHAGINHQAAHNALEALEKAGLVSRRQSGRSSLWTLRTERYLVDEMLRRLFEEEQRHAQEIVTEIKTRLDRKADAVIIVGAASKGRLALGQALELICLCETGKRNTLLMAVRGLQKELEDRFALSLKCEMLSKREAQLRVEIIDGWQLLPTEGRPWIFSAER